MKIYSQTLELAGTADTDAHEVTGQVARAVAASGVAEGTVLVFTPGSTAAVTTIEHESGCLSDLRRLLDQLAPPDGEYAHNLRWSERRQRLQPLAGRPAGAPRSPCRSAGAGWSWAPGSRSWSWISTTAPASGGWS